MSEYFTKEQSAAYEEIKAKSPMVAAEILETVSRDHKVVSEPEILCGAVGSSSSRVSRCGNGACRAVHMARGVDATTTRKMAGFRFANADVDDFVSEHLLSLNSKLDIQGRGMKMEILVLKSLALMRADPSRTASLCVIASEEVDKHFQDWFVESKVESIFEDRLKAFISTLSEDEFTILRDTNFPLFRAQQLRIWAKAFNEPISPTTHLPLLPPHTEEEPKVPGDIFCLAYVSFHFASS